MRPNVRTYLVDDEGNRVFGPGPAELLRRVREHGSLRSAAISMGMAYTKALALVKNAESALGAPLTTRVVGGAGGGGSTPTPEADALLAAYERWTASVNATSQAQFAAAFGKGLALGPVLASEAAGNGRIGVGVLAAGHATRFGSNKLVEPLLGEAVLSRTLGCVPLGLPVVVASASDEVDALVRGRGLDLVRPEGPEQGDSVRALAAFAEAQGWDACLFVPGDQPLLERESLQLIMAVAASRPEAVVRLSWRGHAASPALFPASLFGALQEISGDVGGSAVACDCEKLSVEATWPWELWDIDTPDDLNRARQIVEAGLGRGGSA